jgi:hypothetical protein
MLKKTHTAVITSDIALPLARHAWKGGLEKLAVNRVEEEGQPSPMVCRPLPPIFRLRREKNAVGEFLPVVYVTRRRKAKDKITLGSPRTPGRDGRRFSDGRWRARNSCKGVRSRHARSGLDKTGK